MNPNEGPPPPPFDYMGPPANAWPSPFMHRGPQYPNTPAPITSTSEPELTPTTSSSKSTKTSKKNSKPDTSTDEETQKKDGEMKKKKKAEQEARAKAEEATFTRLDTLIPSDAYSGSEKALFYANIHLLYPLLIPYLSIVSACGTSVSGETYRYLALICISPLEILAESGKFRGRHQEQMGGAKGDEVSFEAKMMRSLYVALEEGVEERLMAFRGRRREARRGGDGDVHRV